MRRFGFGFGIPSGRRASLAAGVLDPFAASLYAAYGLSRLRAGYTDAGVRVRRSSDGAEADIPFTPQGELDAGTLLTFAGAGSAYVAAWYDQSGNGRHASQSVVAGQPRIVNAGVLDVGPNGRAALAFTGSQSMSIAGAAGFARNADNLTIGVVGESSITAGSSAFFSTSRGGNLSWYRAAIVHTPTLSGARFAASSNDMDNPTFASRGYVAGSWRRLIGSARFGAGEIAITIDGETATAALGMTAPSPDSDGLVRVGISPNGGAPLVGHVSALVLSRAALDIAGFDAALEELIQ